MSSLLDRINAAKKEQAEGKNLDVPKSTTKPLLSSSSMYSTLAEVVKEVKEEPEKEANGLLARLAHIKERETKVKQAIPSKPKEVIPRKKPELIPPQPTTPSARPELNTKQQLAAKWASEGRSFNLTGAAGTGKTTTLFAILQSLLPKLPITTFRNPDGGIKEQEEKPSIALTSTTNRAVNNALSHALNNRPELFADNQVDHNIVGLSNGNFITIHKLLEYYPQYFYDEKKGKDSMKFVPNRDKFNKLDLEIIIIEEGSTLPIQFSNVLAAALHKGIIIIILGDINQLPPVFGDSILNVALKRLPTIELTHVYRQALDSPIIRQAHKILRGEVPETDTDDFIVVHGKSKIIAGSDLFGEKVVHLLKQQYRQGKYNPMTDMLLLPWNKHGTGTIRLNTLIAQFLDDLKTEQGSPNTVYEVIAGFNKHYFAVGDRVYDNGNKEEGIIKEIKVNGLFFGKAPQPCSEKLLRIGFKVGEDSLADDLDSVSSDINYDAMNLETMTNETNMDMDTRVSQASHIITVSYPKLSAAEGEEVTADLISAGDINNLSLGYALTTNKAIGCEWDNTYIAIHDTHFNVNREWLYTAVTRAKNSCVMMVTKTMLEKCVARQACKGDTLEAKIEAYNEKMATKLANGEKVPNADLLDLIVEPELPEEEVSF